MKFTDLTKCQFCGNCCRYLGNTRTNKLSRKVIVKLKEVNK